MLDLDRLRAFAVFAQELSFTTAAKRLAISQPALHTKVRRLEEELGTALYRRVGKRLELTPHGIEAQRFGQTLDNQSQDFLASLGGGGSAREAVLSAGEGSLLYLLGPAIRAHRGHGHGLRVHTHNREQTLEALLHGTADIGVTQLDSPAPSQLCQRELTRVHQCLILPRGHRLARKQSIRLSELSGEAWVLPPADRPHRRQVERALRAAGVECEVVVEATGWPLMLHFVRLGLGICIANGCVEVGRGLIRRKLSALPSLGYHLVYREDSLVRPSVAALHAALLEHRHTHRKGAGLGGRAPR